MRAAKPQSESPSETPPAAGKMPIALKKGPSFPEQPLQNSSSIIPPLALSKSGFQGQVITFLSLSALLYVRTCYSSVFIILTLQKSPVKIMKWINKVLTEEQICVTVKP
jgi:hypothetical protein